MKILFLIPYPLKQAPSQRFRFEQYLGPLSARGYSYETHSFFTSEQGKLFFKPGRFFGKTKALFQGFAKRFMILFRLPRFDFVFIHREVTPIGPPVIEWIITFLFNKKIIFDFDDAIWLTDKTDESAIERMLRWRQKTGAICRWSYKVSCGNHFLGTYAARFNPAIVINPTTIETDYLDRPESDDEKKEKMITLGWTGSDSTLKYLKLVEPVIRNLEDKFPQLQFLVIANRPPALDLRSMIFCEWSAKTEIRDLLKIDIGIMPLPDDTWSKGKCGFKALQYMSLGIPAVVSAVGVNPEIIEDGLNGFLCRTKEDWTARLEVLIRDPGLRASLGKAGMSVVTSRYSVVSNMANFLSLFEGSATRVSPIR